MRANVALIFLLMLNLFNIIGTEVPPSCGLYGSPPCQFLPSAPGQTPKCAKPGGTFCENIENYPSYVIKNLIFKLGPDAKTTFVDESYDDFDSNINQNIIQNLYDINSALLYRVPGANKINTFGGYKYEIPTQYNTNINPSNNNDNFIGLRAPEPIYIPRPPNKNFFYYSSLIPSASRFYTKSLTSSPLFDFSGYDRKSNRYDSGNWSYRYRRNPLSDEKGVKISTTEIGKEGSSNRTNSSNSSSLKSEFLGLIEANKHAKHRNKRQTLNSVNKLCDSSSQFITPQAALNTRGDWMYIVNDPSAARQLVKTETCLSTVCSNICQMPNGYSSRCEQKFVQKRLVALSSSGQNLYTDTFWFPSCCVCTLSN